MCRLELVLGPSKRFAKKARRFTHLFQPIIAIKLGLLSCY
jgi:hypothetical protein